MNILYLFFIKIKDMYITATLFNIVIAKFCIVCATNSQLLQIICYSLPGQLESHSCFPKLSLPTECGRSDLGHQRACTFLGGLASTEELWPSSHKKPKPHGNLLEYEMPHGGTRRLRSSGTPDLSDEALNGGAGPPALPTPADAARLG